MKGLGKWTAYIVGGLLLVGLGAVYGKTAIQQVSGLAVAQSRTLWNDVKDAAQGDSLTTGVLAAQLYFFDGSNFDRARGNTTNGLDVNVTAVSGTVTVDGGATAADAFANPTDAVVTFALTGGWNGATWDRLTSTTANGLDVDVTRVGGTVTVDGAITPADAFATPTDAVSAFALLGCFSGADWDLCRTTEAGDNLGTGLLGVGTYETDGANGDFVRHSFNQTTASITTNAGAGTTLDLTSTPSSKYTMIIDRTAGSTDVVEIDLECAIDATDFVQIGTITSLANEPALTSVDGVPCSSIRQNVVTVGSGNTIQIHLLSIR